MPDTSDQRMDPIVKIWHLIADADIDARIRELRRVDSTVQGRIAELEELKHATLEDKKHLQGKSVSLR
jgi:hypothetical protein